PAICENLAPQSQKAAKAPAGGFARVPRFAVRGQPPDRAQPRPTASIFRPVRRIAEGIRRDSMLRRRLRSPRLEAAYGHRGGEPGTRSRKPLVVVALLLALGAMAPTAPAGLRGPLAAGAAP